MARDLFRQRWFPRQSKGYALPSPAVNSNISLTGLLATSALGALEIDRNFNLTGDSVTSAAGAFTPTTAKIIDLVGVSSGSAVSPFAAIHYDDNFNGNGVQANSATSTGHIQDVGVHLTGVQADTEFTDIGLGGIPGDRVFFISGIKQLPIAPGISLFPTSDTVSVQELDGIGYAFGSSQFYTIGEVIWNDTIQTEGVDYTFVHPFNHIIQFNPAGITTDITLIYYKWDIGVRAGFKVNSYPVSFAFNATSIIAEEVPPQNQFFTVQYTSTRPGNNPQSLYARFPNIVDDILSDHAAFDGASGFATARRVGYKVYDTTDNSVWVWDGLDWNLIGPYGNTVKFFVKSTGSIYEMIAGVPKRLYTSGDGVFPSVPEVLTYPPYGESIGKNLLADAFSPSAAINYPSAYVISQRPGPCEDPPALNDVILEGLQAFTAVGFLRATVAAKEPVGEQAITQTGHFVIASSNEGKDLLGVQAVAATGHLLAVSSSIHETPAGDAAVSAVGHLAAVPAKPLAGEASATDLGAFSPSLIITPPGRHPISHTGIIQVTSTNVIETPVGDAAVSAVGNLPARPSKPLAGFQLTSVAGTFAKTLTKALAGLSAHSVQGNLSKNPNQALIGQQVASTRGSLAIRNSKAPLGLAAVTAPGAVIVHSTNATESPSGQQAVTHAGRLIANPEAILPGNAAVTHTGSVGISKGHTTHATGNAAVSHTGTVIVNLGPNPHGQQATSAAGPAKPNPRAKPIGLVGTAKHGKFTVHT